MVRIAVFENETENNVLAPTETPTMEEGERAGIDGRQGEMKGSKGYRNRTEQSLARQLQLILS